MEWYSQASEEVTELFSLLYTVPPADVKNTSRFHSLRENRNITSDILLASIPAYPIDPYRPLHILYVLLTELPGPWPPSPLLYHFTRLTRDLTPYNYGQQHDDVVRLLESTESIVRNSCDSLSQYLNVNDSPALRSSLSDGCITHRQLHQLVASFALPVQAQDRKPVVALVMPTGPLLAALCLAVAAYYVAVPLDPNVSHHQLQSDLHEVDASCVITASDRSRNLRHLRPWLQQRGTKVFTAHFEDSIRLTDERGRDLSTLSVPRAQANNGDDACLILYTKSPWLEREPIALSVYDLLREAYISAEAWSLTPDDIGISLVSAHEGGISKTFLAAVVSGGSVVCGSGFSTGEFWDAIDSVRPTWYLASQLTHKHVLASAPFQPEHVEKSRFRLACGSDGYIPPQLASLINDVFGCDSVTDPLVSDYRLASPTNPTSIGKKSPVGAGDSEQVWERDLHDWRHGSHPRKKGSDSRLPKPNVTSSGNNKTSKTSMLSGRIIMSDSDSMVDLTGKDGTLAAVWSNSKSIFCGGTRIKPEEVEDAIMRATEMEDSLIYRRIARVLAFPTAHDILGQDVAVILVSRPDSPRVGLRALHDALLSVKLDRVKWPMLIVYMDAIPQRAGKPFRTRLQQRFHFPVISSSTTYLSRHWEALCPPSDTSFMKAINRRQCQVDRKLLTSTINSAVPSNFHAFLLRDARNGGYEAFLAPEVNLASLRSMRDDWEEYIRRLLTITTHGYMVPVNIYMLSVAVPRYEDGTVDIEELQKIRAEMRKTAGSATKDSILGHVEAAFCYALGCDTDKIDGESNFYKLGGDAKQAEKLRSRLRADFNVDISHVVLAKDASVDAIARFIEPILLNNTEGDGNDIETPELYSSTNRWLMVLQLLPLIILYPARRSAQWTMQLWLLSRTRFWSDTDYILGRYLNLILAIFGAWAFVKALFPLIGILCKWIIIGRYKEGLYPMWGPYHTRWWMVQKITALCGMGFFDYHDIGKSWYCRLMGAKIGKGVKMNGVLLGEWDLLDIRDGVSLTGCECRPFAAEKNSSMYLARIIVGERATIGVLSIVAPGTEVLPDTCLGANSSSWEQSDSLTPRTSTNNPVYPKIHDAHWSLSVLLTQAIYGLGWCISLTPWLGAQIPSLYKKPQGSDTPLRVILTWFATNPAVAFHYVAVMGRVLITPAIFFGFAVGFRYLSILTFGDIPKDPSQVKGQFPSWRATMMRTLYPASQLVEMNELLGQHSAARSGLLRCLGAKVGKRVIWPDSGPSIEDYHLLDIGDDVTFGSMCHLLTTDEISSGLITIRDDAVISDHSCLLPGVTVGERTTIGFGTLTKRGKEYPSDKTFVGSRKGDVAHSDSFAYRLWGAPTGEQRTTYHQEKGGNSSTTTTRSSGERHKASDVTLSDVSRMEEARGDDDDDDEDYNNNEKKRTERSGSNHNDNKTGSAARKQSQRDGPLYKARFLGQASYFIIPPFVTLCFTMFMTVFTEFYWNVPALSAAKLSARLFQDNFSSLASRWDPLVLYLLNFASTVLLTGLFAVAAIGLILVTKKTLIGTFRPGTYDWDKSSYCQRWQYFVAVEKLIKHCYIDNGGIISLLTGTHWLVLYYRAMGARIGRDCALFAGGNPSLMITETDLIEMGDRVVVDNAAVIPHLDRRGSIQLDRIRIGNRCVLRSASNLLSGTVMEDDSCLMEHTLILPGETIKRGWTMHRRPGERFLGNRKGTIPRA